ncbi:Spo0B domain-containing protein [Paenibacillus sp. TRM 82003]|nr:Spo0B domain-containing protein [Paenibacillus sp. TRM 82003]
MVLGSTVFQSFALIYFSLVFWGTPPRGTLLLRCIGFTIAACLFTTTNFMFIPVEYRLFTMIVGLTGCIFLTFSSLGVRERFRVTATLMVMIFAGETGAGYMATTFFNADAQAMMADPRLAIPYLLPINAMIGAAALIMDRRHIAPGRRIGQALRQRRNRQLSWLLLLYVLNLGVAASLYFNVAIGNRAVAGFTVTIASLLSIVILLLMIRSLSNVKDYAIRTTQETYIEQIDNLFTTIRGQRHDFLNHVQVIQAFVRRGKTEELEKYVNELVGEIVEINDLIQIGNPALAALIKSKIVYALERKVELRYDFEGMERIPQGIASVDYVKIAGNLIDNAIDEAVSHGPEERWVDVRGWTDEEHLHLSVSNPSRPLSEEQRMLLFRPGFTTKGMSNHTGIGLSIVKERVSFYHGDVRVAETGNDVLSFQVKLPLRLGVIAP